MVEIGVYLFLLGAFGSSIFAGISGTNRRNTVHCFLSLWFLRRLLPPLTLISMSLNLLAGAYALADAFTLYGNSSQRFGCL